MTETKGPKLAIPPETCVGGFLEAIRGAANHGSTRILAVVDDYEFDSSAWSAGPRKATAIIGLRVRVECSFLMPMGAVPADWEVRIDTSRRGGCWLCRPGEALDDPDDVMGLAFEGQREMLQMIVLDGVINHHKFRSLKGLGTLKKSYWAREFTYRITAAGLMVSFVAEMEAYR